MKHTITTTSDKLLKYLYNSAFLLNGETIDITVTNCVIIVNHYSQEMYNVGSATNFSFSYEKAKLAALRTVLASIPDQGIALEFSKEQIIIRDIFI